MNFLRGMDIPGNGINAKAIRQLTEESKSYNLRKDRKSTRLNSSHT